MIQKVLILNNFSLIFIEMLLILPKHWKIAKNLKNYQNLAKILCNLTCLTYNLTFQFNLPAGHDFLLLKGLQITPLNRPFISTKSQVWSILAIGGLLAILKENISISKVKKTNKSNKFPIFEPSWFSCISYYFAGP